MPRDGPLHALGGLGCSSGEAREQRIPRRRRRLPERRCIQVALIAPHAHPRKEAGGGDPFVEGACEREVDDAELELVAGSER